MKTTDWRPGLFEDFSRLIKIRMQGREYEVPENNKVLRCLQFLRMERISVGDYCWNGECLNCQFWYQSASGEVQSALGCRVYASHGLVITALSATLCEDLSD